MSSDVLVLGAGTAGSVITRRLIDAGAQVTLVEAGGADTNPAIADLSRSHLLWLAAEDWGWFSAPQVRALDRRLHVPRGKVVGGSGQLNGTIWVRGAAWDYDNWAAAGNVGWEWASVEPVFERIETNLATGQGFMDLVEPEFSPIQQAIFDSAVAYGIPPNADYNHGDQLGVSHEQLNLRDGTRLSTWRAYMGSVLDSPRLTLHTNTLIDSLVLDGERVIGANVLINGEPRRLLADQVVLAAGALSSPPILLRSGIGPADELSRLGIDVRHDLPGVGRNLQDHFVVPVVFGTKDRQIGAPQPRQSVTMTHWFHKTDPALAVPDTQPICFSVPFYYEEMTGPEQGFTLQAALIRPQSAGSVTLATADPGAEPVIDFNLFADESDLLRLVQSLRQCRAVGSSGPLREEWGSYEVLPGPQVGDSEAELAQWVRRAVNTYHHQVGTCRMGIDRDAVVSPTLQVHGLAGVTIADASVMPSVTTGNTNAPTVMIAEKAAEFLLRR